MVNITYSISTSTLQVDFDHPPTTHNVTTGKLHKVHCFELEILSQIKSIKNTLVFICSSNLTGGPAKISLCQTLFLDFLTLMEQQLPYTFKAVLIDSDIFKLVLILGGLNVTIIHSLIHS